MAIDDPKAGMCSPLAKCRSLTLFGMTRFKGWGATIETMIDDLMRNQLPYPHAGRHRYSHHRKDSRPARQLAFLQRLAAGSGHAHVDEQPR